MKKITEMKKIVKWRGINFDHTDICNIKNIAVLVTNTCNSNCYHCFRDTTITDTNIDLNTIRRLSHYLHDSKVNLFHITGGEPFLINGLDNVFSTYSKLGISTSVVSNGYYLTPEYLQVLHTSGLNEISLSVHSYSETLHRQLTGTNGGVQRLLNAINEAKKLGIAIRINLPLSKYNLSTFKMTIEWLERLNVDRIKILRISPFGKASPQSSFLHFTDKEWIDISKEAAEYFSESSVPIKIQRVPLLQNEVSSGHCTAIPFKHLNIDCFGDVYPCCLLNGIKLFSLGNINRVFEIGWGKATQEFTNKLLDMKDLYDSDVLPCLQGQPTNKSSNICPLYSSVVSR